MVRSKMISVMLGIALLGAGGFFLDAAEATTTARAVSPAKRWIGFYQPQAPHNQTGFKKVESGIRTKARVCSFYTNVLGTFDAGRPAAVRSQGMIPMITLEFWDPAKHITNQPKYNMDAILSGKHDKYIRDYAKAAKDFGTTIWVRPFHEMNGNWYPWCGTVNGNTPAKAVKAWKHVVDIFRAEGATNVKFVWCPNAESVPNTSANAIAKYWPGDAYVDIVALDGFNWGVDSKVSWRRWQSFETIFKQPYAQVAKLSKKPIIVAETGCTSAGGSKAVWASDMFKVIPKKFPRIVGVVWMEAKLARDWRIGTSSTNMSAFKTGLQGSSWVNKSTPTLKLKASKKKLKKNKKVTLSGSMTRGKKGDKIRVEVKKPGSKKWTLLKTRTLNSTKKWTSYKYKLSKRGTYRFRTRYTAGDFTRRTATSKTVKVVVR